MVAALTTFDVCGNCVGDLGCGKQTGARRLGTGKKISTATAYVERVGEQFAARVLFALVLAAASGVNRH